MKGIGKRIIAVLLVLELLFAPVLPVWAEEVLLETEPDFEQEFFTDQEETLPEATEFTEATEATEEAEATEETPQTETFAETEPSEEPDAAEETEPPEENKTPEAADIPQETEAILETEVSEEPEDTQVPEPSVPKTVAEILAAEPGEEMLVLEGTVVFAAGIQAVLQDSTGGIRLSFSQTPELVPGDVIRVSGRRSGGFAVADFEKTGTGPLPAVEASLEEGRSGVRILVKGAVLGRNSLTQRGITCSMTGTVPADLEIGQRVDAWGVMLDGVFYADTLVLSENQEPPETGESLDGNWNFYFGQLHAHTDISDGAGTVEEAFAYARQVEHLDFFAVTDHSNSFDNAGQGSVAADGSTISREWAAGKEAAAAVTDENFVGIFGYEMTWQEDRAIGHISTFGTPGWQTREQEGMETLEGYLDALAAAADSVSQFNHPGMAYGDFGNFAGYNAQHDTRIHLLEVGSEGGFRAYDAYTVALDAGWHLAPSNNQNNHNGNWGDAGQVRTVVLAEELTEAAIYDAVRHYRVYATEDRDLKILYRVNGRIMGSVMGDAPALTAEILVEDGSGDAVGRVEVVTDGGTVASFLTTTESRGEYTLALPTGGSYYYLRILRDGEIAAVTAPVWVDRYEDLGIADLTADVEKPEQGTETLLTLSLFNNESIPFVVESVTFSVGSQVIDTLSVPDGVAPVGEWQIPLRYSQANPGTVTITATVTGSIGGLPRSYQKQITLHFQAPAARELPVGEVRQGNLGEAYRIRGYVTAGTANSHNTFPGSIYLQDATGGIEVRDFTAAGIQVGTPMEIEGILRSAGGNLVLAMTDYTILDEDFYRFAPRTMSNETAMNYETHGGSLLQIEGSVVSITYTPDKKGVARFTIRDIVGDLATVVIESDITSGVYGTNELASEVKNTRTVRAIGLLHMDEYGTTVLRVRNCDEVAYVPPRKDPTNPKTGDWLAWLKF